VKKLGRNKFGRAMAESVPEKVRLAGVRDPDAYAPHVWFDVSLWSDIVQFTGQQLGELDPENRSLYMERAVRYSKRLDSLHAAAYASLDSIPEEQRLLITSHDAFRYFGRAYDIEVKGLQGLSTVSGFGLKDVTNLVNLIIKRNIKAVFVENSVSQKAIRSVVEGCRERGHEVSVGGTLYSDAMGEKGTFEGTYIGMVNHNVRTIVDALK
jgi:manganese/zinc/iron transport system substrate-binding protein